MPAICGRADRPVSRPGQFRGYRRDSSWRWSRGSARRCSRRWARRQHRRGIGCRRRHRPWRRQCPECSGIPAATIQYFLCAVHGVAEISAAAIVCGTGAGLCAGPRLSPAAELCTGLRLSPATELCAALGWSRNATTMTQRSRFIAKSGIYGRYRVLADLDWRCDRLPRGFA